MPNDPQTLALLESFKHIIPEMVLGLAACILFVGGTIRAGRHLWGTVALVSLVVGGIAVLFQPPPALASDTWRTALYSAAFVTDSLAMFIKIVALAGGVLLLLLSWNEVPDNQAADHHACLLVIVAGLCLTAAANDLITLFLSLELISIPTYVLLYLPRHDEASQEAAMKYFLLSIFSSAFLLFGFSYLYGLTGTTNLATLLHTLSTAGTRELPGIALVALVMVVAGLGFRITAVPFHFYAPDVYEGTSTSGAALLAFVPKVAGFVALVRVLGFVLPDPVIPVRDTGLLLTGEAPILFALLATITMCIGNFLALLQDNLKRLLAYSSVAHAGYMLIALSVTPYLRGGDGVGALLYYLVAYGAMTVGAFAVIAFLHTSQRPVQTIDDLAGLGSSHPGVAILMMVFLFSLIGIPLTAGFTGKFLIFFGAMSAQAGGEEILFRILAVIGVVNAAIGAWYYLRIVAAMYLRNPLKPPEPVRAIPGLVTVLMCALLTVGLSIPPAADWLLGAVRAAAGPTNAPAVQAKP